VTLCATIPTNATISEVQLFARPTDSETPWSDSQIRMAAGRESGQARFAEKYSESPDERPGTRQVCQAFTHWATDRGRVARMLVRYTLKD
jgi:hypothetical protein